MCTCFLCDSEHSLCVVPVCREVSIHCKLPCFFKQSPNHWSCRSVPVTCKNVRAVAETCYTRTHLSLPAQESFMRWILDKSCRTSKGIWVTSFDSRHFLQFSHTHSIDVCTKPLPHITAEKCYVSITPFHHDNLGWNQCWVGFRNCTKPLLVITWFVGAHNCGSQKSKNWFSYLGKPWISIIKNGKNQTWALRVTIDNQHSFFPLPMFSYGFQ